MHTYTVEINDRGNTTECACPSDTYHSGKCKHRKAVENTEGSLRPTDCTCLKGSNLPCWPCFRDGFESPHGGTQ